MKTREYRYFVGDFETTTYKNQVNTEVWASASVELFTEEVNVFHSIDEQFDYFCNIPGNLIVYYHNLKFDGNFWLSFLFFKKRFSQAYIKTKDGLEWLSDKDMPTNSYKYSISDRGQWYTITIKLSKKIIEIRDSLKLLPFSVKKIGKSFGTKHKKLDIKYKGFRYAGCEISDKEKEYIANDTLVVKEALEIMFNQGHSSLTIGSCCLSEFKKFYGKEDYEIFFPNIYDIQLDEKYKYKTAGDYVVKSYRGGWCYLVKGAEGSQYHHGCTLDVNSLYPSMMHSISGNRYPVGKPKFWSGDYIPKLIKNNKNYYYFVRFKCRFKIKEGYLPFIQIKNNLLYDGTEMLETSDIYDKKEKKHVPFYFDTNGELKQAIVELTLTCTDWILFNEHYNIYDLQILDGCYFRTEIGLFDNYIDKYKKIKMESKGAIRELAKLFLNNLYGKLAASTDSSFKIVYEKDAGVLSFDTVTEHKKKPGYIPIGSAITSYARNFTIRAAQKNYHGVDKPGFKYADTDSIHCDCDVSDITGVTVDDKEFCCWKAESFWDLGLYTRQKTYIEHVTHENFEPIEPYYNVKCAGMPDKCKRIFMLAVNSKNVSRETLETELEDMCEDEEEKAYVRAYIKQGKKLSDFKIGLEVPGKLRPKRIKGGVLLVDCSYKMH